MALRVREGHPRFTTRLNLERSPCHSSSRAWVEPKGHLLPFCSHTTLKHPERSGTKDYHWGTDNCRSFLDILARSEGCRHGLKTTHNPKVAGSNPAPATSQPLTPFVYPDFTQESVGRPYVAEPVEVGRAECVFPQCPFYSVEHPTERLGFVE